MPETTATKELPPRTTATSTTRGLKKSATLSGGRTSASTTDIESAETSSKTNGHRRTSSSLFRKASTISRTNETPTTADDPNAPSLKKSRSLMNVLRSKLHSPAVLRRFRSKSRESSKHTVTEISSQPVDDHEPEIQPANQPEPTTRKSRKRDPSPMRRLANRITQLTRHHKTTSPDRQSNNNLRVSFLLSSLSIQFVILLSQQNLRRNQLPLILMKKHENRAHHYITRMKLNISMHAMMKFGRNILLVQVNEINLSIKHMIVQRKQNRSMDH